MKKTAIIGCMILGLLVFVPSVGVPAQYDYELAYGHSGQDEGYRNAVAMDDWLERGRAAVAESPVFSDGIRITAWGGAETDEPGLASAIYYFNVPHWAQYLKINIRYNDAAQDDQIAGRLWIKSIDHDMHGEIGVGQEAPFYGDTFVLRSERSSETIIVPASRHVAGGMLEMHVVAEGSDSIDVRDIRIAYLDTRPQIRVVHRTYSDYWHRWPRHRYAYHYYYWGPLYWPRTYVVYECWDVPSRFYWTMWRPWFFFNIIRVHCHRPWWGPRRYTVVYHVHVKHPLHKRRHLLRTRLKERHPRVTRIIRPKPVIHRTDRTAPVRPRPPQRQEARLNREVKNPRTFENRVDPSPAPQYPKERSIRSKKARANPTVNTRATTTTVKRPQVINRTDPRPARTSTTAPQRIPKHQPQTRTAKQQQHPRSRDREKAVQSPVPTQANNQGTAVSKADTEVTPAPIRRPSTDQLTQERKRPAKLTVNERTKTVKRSQVISTPDSRPANPSHTTQQRIHTNQQQPRPRSVKRETVRETPRVRTARNHRAEPEAAIQNRANSKQRNTSQSPQVRPQARQRRSR